MTEPVRLRWKGSAVVLSIAAVVGITVGTAAPRYRGAAAQVFVIAAGALVIRILLRAVRIVAPAPEPLAFDRALIPPPARTIVWANEPDRIAFEVGAATHRSMELHHQFRSRLRRLAADRLEADHGVDLDADQDAARRLLGEGAWALLRPDLVPPDDRFGPGMPIGDVATIVTAVEALAR
jgi:hypothetical protein